MKQMRLVWMLGLLAAMPLIATTAWASDYTYVINANNTLTITGYTGAGGDVVIPGVIDGKVVAIIGEQAFDYCTGLTSVTIPDSVTTIGVVAFRGCTELSSLMIPDSVTTIGDSSFRGCTGLTSVTIPDSVTTIGDRAFQGCTGLTSVTIPNSITTIQHQVFDGCTGLKSLIIPDSVTTLEYRSFYGCTGLTSLTIPSGITSWWSGMYPNNSFGNCTGLTNLTLVSGLSTIGRAAFEGCTGLTSLIIPDSVTTIGGGAFKNCTGLTNLTIPCNTSFDNINSFGGAFQGCTGLMRLTLPEGFKSIGYFAFAGCTGLTSLTIPGSVTSIGEGAFSGCTGLPDLTIPDSVTVIGGSAFSGCTNLLSITIPDSVTTIGGSVFQDCTALSTAVVGTDLTTLGDYAFKNCPALAGVYFKGNAPDAGTGVFDGSLSVTAYYLSGTLGWAPTFCNRPTALWEITPASIISHPLSQAKDVGETASFSVTASGTPPLYYQWQKDGESIGGANSSNYSIPAVAYADAGQYRCIVSNMENSVTSSVALLRVSAPDPDLGPSVRANNCRGTIYAMQGEPITISITMAAGAYVGANADWWVIAVPSYGANWYYLNTLMQWSAFPANDLTALQPAYQGPLMDIQNPVTLLSEATLMPGTYIFHFAVDQMDGILNYPDGPMLVDSVTVVVE